ncbi:hypothetical protein VE04_03151 [Pseudogymnoascus sp. 24MN13]|nr:hypothetical protein VE04_03151 [Pseudogymnoascus sp. 24MN13]
MTTTNATRQEPAQSFTLFPQLPVELQRRIWELCLPARIVELDRPITENVTTPCSMYNTSQFNSRIPIAVQICKESRSVALLAGFKQIYDGNFVDSDAPGWKAMNSIKDLWVTPSVDVLHLNYGNCYDVGRDHPSDNPLQFLLWLRRRLGHSTRISIVAPLVLAFNDYQGAEFMTTYEDKNLDLLTEAGGSYLTTLCVVSLHLSLDAALRKEGGMLFGRLGEERVKLVRAGDKTALKAYYKLWAAGPRKALEPVMFFELALVTHESEWLPRVAQWKQRLVTKWVTHNLRKAEAKNNCADIQDPEGIFRTRREDEWRAVLQGDSGPFSDYMRPPRGWAFLNHATDVTNTEHPWVAKVLRDMPCFEPMVMFRLCADKCYAPKPPRPQHIIGGQGTVSGREKSDADDPLKNQHATDLVYYDYCYGGSVFVTL